MDSPPESPLAANSEQRRGADLGPDLTPRIADALEEATAVPSRAQPILGRNDPESLLAWENVRSRVYALSALDMEAILRQLGVEVPSGKENRMNAAVEGLQALVKRARQEDRMAKAEEEKAAQKRAEKARKEEEAATKIQSGFRMKRDKLVVAERRRLAAEEAERRRIAAEKAENWRRAQKSTDRVVECAIIWLHGLGETEGGWEEAFSSFSGALPEAAGRCRWLWPRAAVSRCSARGGAMTNQWFDVPELPVCGKPTDPGGTRFRGLPDRPRREEDPSEVDVAVYRVTQTIAALEAEGIPAHRIAVGGFEQGGAVAIHSVLRYPRELAGMALIGAWLPCFEDLAAKATPAGRKVSFLWCHGARDAVVEPKVARVQCKALREELGVNGRFRLFPEFSYGIDMEVLSVVSQWLVEQLTAAAARSVLPAEAEEDEEDDHDT